MHPNAFILRLLLKRITVSQKKFLHSLTITFIILEWHFVGVNQAPRRVWSLYAFLIIIFYDLVVLKINNNFYVANVIFIQIYVFLVVTYGREAGVEIGIHTCRMFGHNFGSFFVQNKIKNQSHCIMYRLMCDRTTWRMSQTKGCKTLNMTRRVWQLGECVFSYLHLIRVLCCLAFFLNIIVMSNSLRRLSCRSPRLQCFQRPKNN